MKLKLRKKLPKIVLAQSLACTAILANGIYNSNKVSAEESKATEETTIQSEVSQDKSQNGKEKESEAHKKDDLLQNLGLIEIEKDGTTKNDSVDQNEEEKIYINPDTCGGYDKIYVPKRNRASKEWKILDVAYKMELLNIEDSIILLNTKANEGINSLNICNIYKYGDHSLKLSSTIPGSVKVSINMLIQNEKTGEIIEEKETIEVHKEIPISISRPIVKEDTGDCILCMFNGLIDTESEVVVRMPEKYKVRVVDFKSDWNYTTVNINPHGQCFVRYFQVSEPIVINNVMKIAITDTKTGREYLYKANVPLLVLPKECTSLKRMDASLDLEIKSSDNGKTAVIQRSSNNKLRVDSYFPYTDWKDACFQRKDMDKDTPIYVNIESTFKGENSIKIDAPEHTGGIYLFIQPGAEIKEIIAKNTANVHIIYVDDA